MNKKLTAWLLIALAAFACYLRTSNALLAVILVFALAALLTPLRTLSLLRDNTIDAELNLNAFLDAAINAFRAAVLPLTMFASTFRNVQLKGTDKVEVLYYPLDTTAAKDFDQDEGYVFDEDTNTAHREITVNKRKYVSMGLTGRDLARIPLLNAEKLGALKGQNLAYQIIQDILSVITHANYGTDAFVGASGTFDSDDIIDIRTAVNSLTTDGRPTPWPEVGRGLLVNPAYDGALLKDTAFKAAYSLGTDQAIRTGRLPNIFGFDYAASAAVPSNNQHLVGFASYMSAVLVAFSPIEPPASVRKLLVDYRINTDADTGISFEYREWGDPDFDMDKRVIECNYGFAKGEGSALLPIRSAAYNA
jgi:hypothetical protein